MVDPALSALFKALLPLVRPAVQKAARLHAERRAGVAPNFDSDVMEASFRDTLGRLAGGDLEEGWWQRLTTEAIGAYVSPAALQKPAVRDWLSSNEAHAHFYAIAKARVMGQDLDHSASREWLSESYANATGEGAHLAEVPIDVVVAILAAGYLANVPADQRATFGAVQQVGQGVAKVERKLDDLAGRVRDPLVERVHSQEGERALETILVQRTFDFEAATDAIQVLHRRLDKGELSAADDTVKRRIRYWTARMCAVSSGTLDLAKAVRSSLEAGETAESLVVVDAWIAATSGDLDHAIRLLRSDEDPDARTALLTLLARDTRETEALEWFADADPATSPGYFTDHGWRVWAVSLAKLSRWEAAARGLRALGDGPDWSPALAATEGMVNAALLLPEDQGLRQLVLGGTPLHHGIGPRLDPSAIGHHQRATDCFEYVSDQLDRFEDDGLHSFVVIWRRWLELMDPDLSRQAVAKERVRSALEEVDTDAIGMLDFALAFGISFDPDALRADLQQSERFGGLDNKQTRAQCLLNQMTMPPGEFVSYVVNQRQRLERVMGEQSTTAALFDALIADQQYDRAASALPAAGEIDDAVRTRMLAVLHQHQGKDASADLRSAYEKTGQLVDLHNLIGHLESTNDHADAFPYIHAMFNKAPTLPNARKVIDSLAQRGPSDHGSILSFLDENPQFVEQSGDMMGAKAWALFHEGQLDEARELADTLLARRHARDDLALDVNIAVAQGDWDRLPAIVHREWPNRHELGAAALLTLARLASHTLADRAIELAKLATEKAPDDPHVLTEAYGLHFELGRDQEADPQWLSHALEQTSEEEGPIWRTDLEHIVTEILPRQQEQRGKIERMLIRGELPLVLAAGMSNTPLSRVLLERSSDVQDQFDGRRRPVLPIASGARSPVFVRPEWTIGLDVTSAMLLARLDLLDAVIESCGRIKIAPEVMEALFVETFAVRFHQPTRVEASKRLRSLLDHGRMAPVSPPSIVAPEVQNEVGPELAALLAAGQQDDGVVICVRPIHKAQSLMEIVADTSAFDDIIFTPADLCLAARSEGLVEHDRAQRAMAFLASQGQNPARPIPASKLRGPIVLDRLALSYLENAKAFRQNKLSETGCVLLFSAG